MSRWRPKALLEGRLGRFFLDLIELVQKHKTVCF